MILGSVLISNVFSKGGGSESSKYNLVESCNDKVKGKQVTITGNRNIEKTSTRDDSEATTDKNVDQSKKFLTEPHGGPPGFGNSSDANVFSFNQENHKNHFELPPVPFVRLKDGTTTQVPVNPTNDQLIKDSLQYKKTLPLKERRVFNVCSLPIGNPVDGFNFNKIEGTKKSDILLGTGAADFISGKDGGDVIQARDDDIVQGGKGDDSIQGGFGNDNIHGDEGDDAIFAGPNDDYLNGGSGNDELYGQDGDDILEGGPGADFFDCGPGYDVVVVDFNPSEGDVVNDNCEDVRTIL